MVWESFPDVEYGNMNSGLIDIVILFYYYLFTDYNIFFVSLLYICHIYIILCTYISYCVYDKHCLVLMVGLLSSTTKISTIFKKGYIKLQKQSILKLSTKVVF